MTAGRWAWKSNRLTRERAWVFLQRGKVWRFLLGAPFWLVVIGKPGVKRKTEIHCCCFFWGEGNPFWLVLIGKPKGQLKSIGFCFLGESLLVGCREAKRKTEIHWVPRYIKQKHRHPDGPFLSHVPVGSPETSQISEHKVQLPHNWWCGLVVSLPLKGLLGICIGV